MSHKESARRAWLQIQPGEYRIVACLAAALALNAVATQLSWIVSVSGLVTGSGADGMLWVWIVDFLLLLVITVAQVPVIDRFERRSLVRWLAFGTAALFVLLQLAFQARLPSWLSYGALYVLAEQQWLLFPLLLWVVANDVLRIDQTRRLFPILSASAVGGKLLGIGLAAVAPAFLAGPSGEAFAVLNVNVALYLGLFVLLTLGLPANAAAARQRAPEPVLASLSAGWRFLRETQIFRLLLLASIALTIADTIVEYGFLRATASAYPDHAAYQLFYSAYRLATTLAILIVQTFLARLAIERWNSRSALLALPGALALGAFGMIAAPGMLSGVAALGASKVVKDGLDEPARKSLLNLATESRRGRLSLFLDAVAPAVGTILGCALTLLLVALAGARAQALALGAAGGAALAAAALLWRLRQGFDMELMSGQLNRRRRAAAVLQQLDDL